MSAGNDELQPELLLQWWLLRKQQKTVTGAVVRGAYFSGRAPSASAVCSEAVDSGPQLPYQSPCWWWIVVRRLRAQLGPCALEDSASASSCKRTVGFNMIVMCQLICQLGDFFPHQTLPANGSGGQCAPPCGCQDLPPGEGKGDDWGSGLTWAPPPDSPGISAVDHVRKYV